MKKYCLATLTVLFLFSCSKRPETIYLNDYLDEHTEDAGAAIIHALSDCRKKGSTLVLPGGVLPIKAEYCHGEYLRISNNDANDKRIAFNVDGFDNLTIQGNGTTLLFSGFVTPFVLRNSSNVVIRNLNIDYTRTFNSEGLITGFGKDWVKLRFPEEYNTEINQGILVFKDKEGRTYPYSNLLEFDSTKKEVAHYVHDYWIWGSGLQAEKLADGDFKVYKKDIEVTVGNVLVFGAAARYNPAFTLDECSGILLENVNIWHCGGMGVIAQRTRDIELNKVSVVPSPGKDRMISITADATHFVNCKGYIRLLDCVFMNQKDDATNIHGWYSVARKKLSDKSLLLWSNYGKDFARPGMKLEFVNHRNMMTYDTLEVASIFKYNDWYSEVSFKENLPEDFIEGDAVADISSCPDVLIKGCKFGNNRARGLLIGSKGKVLIEGNYFHVPGSAILFEGDGNYWYEQSGVKDVTIRNNIFENCLYGSSTWGSAYIAVGSGTPEKESSRYHSSITIEDNLFRTYDPRIVNLYCVDGVVIRNNKVEMNDEYICTRGSDSIITEYCDNIRID